MLNRFPELAFTKSIRYRFVCKVYRICIFLPVKME